MTEQPSEPDAPARARPAWASRFLSARGRVRRTRGGHVTWKVAVAAVGSAVVLAGLVMLATPGPGWAAVLLGLAILSTEFEWAARSRHAVVRRLTAGAHRVRAFPPWLAALTLVAVVAALAVLGYATVAVFGVPDWVPAGVRDTVRSWPLVRG
ncbi:MAG: PGPGW domain-containing protein [Kineosporiaceae bacterium]